MLDYLWWRDGVIYQIYTRSFADSNGDGVGDLPGVTAHLDYLHGPLNSLGVDAILLSPVHPSPGHDFGYDVTDYEAIDPAQGTLEDFDRLINEAHKRGLRVIMDLVLNHTSHEHPWFIESRSSRSNPKRDWYLWRDAAPGGGLPNNWQSAFGGSAWEWDADTGQYYYHAFLKEQPDLNWRHPAVRERMLRVVRFWLERGVDGFRLDAVNGYFKDGQFRDNPLAPGTRPFDQQRHLYDRDQPEQAGLLRDLRRLLDEHHQRMSVGEVMGADPAIAALYCGNGSDQLHLAFNFHFTHQPWRPRALLPAILRAEAAFHPDAWPCYVLSHHDIERHATRFGGGPFGDERAKVAGALLLTLRGTPFLYYGEELGMHSPALARSEVRDPLGKRYPKLGRDPARTPMQWAGAPGAGFTTGRPWLRPHPDYLTRNAAAQETDPNSVLNFYKRLIYLRRVSPALRRGDFTPLIHAPSNLLAYARRSPEQTLIVALNLFGWESSASLDESLPTVRWQVRVTSVPGTHERVRVAPYSLHLAPFEACVLEAV